MRLMSKGEYVIVPKGTKFTGAGKLGLTLDNDSHGQDLGTWCENRKSALIVVWVLCIMCVALTNPVKTGSMSDGQILVLHYPWAISLITEITLMRMRTVHHFWVWGLLTILIVIVSKGQILIIYFYHILSGQKTEIISVFGPDKMWYLFIAW